MSRSNLTQCWELDSHLVTALLRQWRGLYDEQNWNMQMPLLFAKLIKHYPETSNSNGLFGVQKNYFIKFCCKSYGRHVHVHGLKTRPAKATFRRPIQHMIIQSSPFLFLLSGCKENDRFIAQKQNLYISPLDCLLGNTVTSTIIIMMYYCSK